LGGIALLQELRAGKKVTGAKQSRRAIRDGLVLRVYLARDADPNLTGPLRALCQEMGVPVAEVPTMQELGQAAGIQVGAAVAALLR